MNRTPSIVFLFSLEEKSRMYKDSIKCIPLSLEEESRMYRDSIKCIPLSLEKDSRMYKDSIKCLSSLSLGEGRGEVLPLESYRQVSS
jgi:hypothetical protein